MIDEQLAPPFAVPVQFPDIDPETLTQELHPARQTMPPDLWDAYLRRILADRVPPAKTDLK